MKTRRQFIRSAVGAAAFSLAAIEDDGLRRVWAAGRRLGNRSGREIAGDERHWREIQAAFNVDRNYVNLNNGGVSPSPRIVQDAMRRYLELSNAAPAHTMWKILEPQVEMVRRRLARAFGCDTEEIAITRNASEALETIILGLDLRPGDEVIATNQNYPRMINTWKQRALREGIVFRTFSVPTNPSDPEELVEAYRRNITPKTRVMEVCHVTNLNGQIYPVRKIVELGRERGIEVLVDGAHSFAHFPFTLADLGCDFFGTSLHKWLLAPHGTGFLFVRKARIKDVWPLMAAPAPRSADIRKFEEIGTHPAANHNAIAEALTFHQGIGPECKTERLRYLSRYWMSKLQGRDRIRILTNDDPTQSCALRLLSISGIKPRSLASYLLEQHGVIVAAIEHPEFQGIRVTPNVYTTLEELNRFTEAIERVLRRGIPVG